MINKIFIFCFCTLISIFFIPLTFFAASFDCGKATSKIEKLICGNEELSKLDESLNDAYLKALNRNDIKKGTIESQKQWLKNERDVCQDEECIKRTYENRIKELGFSSSYGLVFFREPNPKTASQKTPMKETESKVMEPSDKVTQTQTGQQSILASQDDKIFIKGCDAPIPYKRELSERVHKLYKQAFYDGYEMGLKKIYNSTLEADQILKNKLINQFDYQEQAAWYYGWHEGRWYGVAQATGHGCITQMTPWPLAPLKIRYAFFREAMKSSFLNRYGFDDGVFMLNKESKPYCKKLLPDILNDNNIVVVEPLSSFENIDHPALANYRSCDNKSALHFQYDDFNRINPQVTSFSKIGTQAFRYYGDLSISKNKVAKNVIYSESQTYFAGYSALNSQSCELYVLTSNNPTTFHVNEVRSLSDNFLIKWRGKYINLEAYGDPPYTLRADSLDIREEGFHSIECIWVRYSKDAARSNIFGGTPVPKSIIKE